LTLAAFSQATALHPDLVRQLVRLALLEATRAPGGELLFAPSQVGRAWRIQRLRTGLSLNYSAVGLVLDLLDRIDVLEAALRRATPTSAPRPNPAQPEGGSDPRWIRTG
jgi:hypothetical protein